VPTITAHDTVALTVRQRCFYLFCALLLLLVSVPFLEDSPHGRIALNAASLLVLIAATAAIGRGRGSLVVALLFALPTAAFQVIGIARGEAHFLILSQAFAAAFYFFTVSYLLTYTLRREVLTVDKLYGAAAAYLMLAILWFYFYTILLAFHPGALTMNGAPISTVPASTMMFFSLATLTATGMSDLMPVHPVARMLCAFEMVTGVLFIAVLIARLAGSYPPPKR
jgi:hypothetical protein